MTIYTKVLLIYVFAMFQEVSLLFDYCGNYTCFYGYCCFNRCCYRVPEMPGDLEPSPYIPVFAVFGSLLGFSCLLMICILCHKKCKGSEQSQPEEPTRTQPIPPPPTAPPGPTVPPLMQASDPPPYSEVVGKPYFYPIPMGQPPCYENIAMEDLSSLESAQPPGPMPKDNS